MRIDLDDIRSSQAGLDSCGVYTSGNSLINEADSADRPEDTGFFPIPIAILPVEWICPRLWIVS